MTLIERNILTPPQSDGLDEPSVAQMVSSILTAVRRHVWLLVGCVVVCLILAVVSIVTMTPTYTASATIYIDPRESRGFQEAGGVLLNSDALIVDSEVEILLSSVLAERVAEQLGLASVVEVEPDKPTFTARLKALFSSDTLNGDEPGVLSPEEAAMRQAVAGLRRNVEVGRLGNTYVIEITARHTDKQLVAAIANTYTEEYLKSDLETQADRLAQLNTWSSAALRGSISKLHQAEEEVTQFRLVNQIDSDDRLVVRSELVELNAALVALRNERFQNELIFERVQNFLSEGNTNSEVPDVGTEEIAQIRSQILEAEIDYARMIANGMENSSQASVMTDELDALKAQLVDQYQRIATQLSTQIQFSIEEEQRLESRGETLRQDVANVAAKEGKLRELQMRVDGERAVYQALLTRFHETSDAFSYNSSSARILTPAYVPAGPSSPQTSKILVLGLFAGLFIGLVLTFIREQMDNRIRQPKEIEALGLRFIGAVPKIQSAWFGLRERLGRRRRNHDTPALTGGRRSRDLARMSYAVDFPLSEFSESMRSIVFDAAASNPTSTRAQIIAVTSTVPGEGKSTLAANLAAYFAKQGKRVHLIDFDLKNPDLSRSFATRRAEEGLSDASKEARADTAQPNMKREVNYEFSGQLDEANMSDMIEFVSPSTIVNYLESLKTNCDIVILDVGSLSESSDARMCADLSDYVVLAVGWGMTTLEQLERSLARGLNRTGKSMGAVLTMVPSSARLEQSASGDPTPRQLAVA